jgi:hypothetical protein
MAQDAARTLSEVSISCGGGKVEEPLCLLVSPLCLNCLHNDWAFPLGDRIERTGKFSDTVVLKAACHLSRFTQDLCSELRAPFSLVLSPSIQLPREGGRSLAQVFEALEAHR